MNLLKNRFKNDELIQHLILLSIVKIKEAQNGINTNKKKSNVKVTVNVDGVPLKKYASLKLIKYLVGLFGVSALIFFGLHKIKSMKFVTGLLSQ